ncbi:MAG: hypothetical protein N2Z22_01735 [Turneriella sp.]|nr:hypothetical protein [Turneriella sp.]
MRAWLAVAFLLVILCLPLAAEKKNEKPIYILHEPQVKIQTITLGGILSKLSARELALNNASELSGCDGKVGLVVAIGRAALDKALEYCKETPVIFSLVSAPQQGNYKVLPNVTGVSFDLSFRLFLTELKKILPEGSKIGFIYSSAQNDFLTGEMGYIESDFNLIGVRLIAEDRAQIGAHVKPLIENEQVQAIWVLPDPLYNQAVFKKLAAICREKRVLLVTTFEVLVKEAGAALALAPNYFDTGVQTAELAQKVLAGTPPSRVAYQRPRQFGVYINLELFEKWNMELPTELRYKEKVTTLLNEAIDLQNAGKSNEALPKFREALKYDKQNTTARYFVDLIEARQNYALAQSRLNAGNKLGALPLLLSAARILPEARAQVAGVRAELRGEAQAFFERGVAQFKNRKYNECIQSMNMALMIDPTLKEAELYKEKSNRRARAVAAIKK